MSRRLTTGGLLAALLGVAGKAPANEHCLGTFQMSLTPIMALPGEVVTLKARITQVPSYFTFYDFTASLRLPLQVELLLHTFHVPAYPEGIFDKKTLSEIRLESEATYSIGIVSERDAWSQTGLVWQFDLGVTNDATPGRYEIRLLEGLAANRSLECWEAEPAVGSLVVVPPSALPGDLDGDGSFSLADARTALVLLIGSMEASPGVLRRGDVWPPGGDGRLTLEDARALLRRALGLEPP